jgi:hypothetical protein
VCFCASVRPQKNIRYTRSFAGRKKHLEERHFRNADNCSRGFLGALPIGGTRRTAIESWTGIAGIYTNDGFKLRVVPSGKQSVFHKMDALFQYEICITPVANLSPQRGGRSSSPRQRLGDSRLIIGKAAQRANSSFSERLARRAAQAIYGDSNVPRAMALG